MARVLVGSLYFLRLDPKRWAEHQPFPPLGTLYAASVLREEGHDVHMFDAMIADGIADWQARLGAVRPDVAVLFDDNFNYLSKMCLSAMRKAALAMIAAANALGTETYVCSADSSDHPDIYLAAGARAVIVGEGEATLRELLASPSLERVAGLAFESADGAVVRTPPRGLIRDLDSLPLPAWDLVDIGAYRLIWHRHHGRFALNLVTSRGCPYRCNWCAKPIWGQSYAVRSPAAVVRELALLNDIAAPDYIWFMDDIMGLKPKWLAGFADALEAAGIKLPFKCLSRADLLLRDNAAADLKRAGCDIVWMGAESGSQQILDAMDKDVATGAIVDATARLKQAGIRVGHFLQFGYPGEGMAEIAETLSLLRATEPDEIGISVSYPLPNTAFYDRVADELRGKRNWAVSSDMAMLYRGPFATVFYRHLHAYVHREFRMRRSLKQLRRAASAGSFGATAHLRALAFVALAILTRPFAWAGLHALRLAPHAALPHGEATP